jgi:hypothetical protein
MNPDEDLRGIFLYGAHLLQLDQHGLVPSVHDPDDLKTIGILCVLVNRLTEQGDTPFDGTLNALAVLASSLIAADEAGLPVPHLVPKWRKTLAAACRLHLVGSPIGSNDGESLELRNSKE